jgi:CHC2 zinc finger
MQTYPSKFEPALLPSPQYFYERELGRLSRHSRGWAMGKCPFHESKSGRSFAVNLATGGFYCFGCDAKGGDEIDFVRQRDGCDFKTAAKCLGAWVEDGARIRPTPREEILVEYLTCDFVIDGVEYLASVKDEPRDYADKIRRFYREASDRLIELSQGDSERDAGERDECWERMACALPELRELGIP